VTFFGASPSALFPRSGSTIATRHAFPGWALSWLVDFFAVSGISPKFETVRNDRKPKEKKKKTESQARIRW
jgi:hypothetical protein